MRRAAVAVVLLAALTGWAEEPADPSSGHGNHGATAQDARKTARSGLGASAAIDDAGVVRAVHVQGGRLVFQRSETMGEQWSEPLALTEPGERIEADGDARPKIAVGPAGAVYVTWTRPLGKPYTGEIRFAHSVDGGRTFSAPLTVHADRQLITHRFDAVTVARDGRVFVAWIDRRDAFRAKAEGQPEYRGAAVYFAVSDDHGTRFRGDFKVADHSCECCRIALLPRADGSVDALWRHVFEPNVRDHALATLRPDGTATQPRRATFDDWHIDACPHHGPSLVADGGGALHAVWFAQPAEGAGAFYGRLTETGVDGLLALGVGRAEHPDIAASGDRVVVAWKAFDGTATRLQALVSDDRGGTWREQELASTRDASGQPQVLRSGDTFVVFWKSRAEGLGVYPVR